MYIDLFSSSSLSLHRKSNQITDADQLERGSVENASPSNSPSQTQTQMATTATVSQNLSAVTSDLHLANITTQPQPLELQDSNIHHTRFISPSSITIATTTQEDVNLTSNSQLKAAASASSSKNVRPVRPNDLCIPGQNGSMMAACKKKKPLYGRSISLDLPPRQQTLTQSSYA